jgi:hypothetical protein
MSLRVYLLSLIVSLLFVSSFGIVDYVSGQLNTTIPQPRELQSIQNASQTNEIQIQGNGSAGNMSNPCDPSYPNFCVTTYTANLTCSDIPYGNFTVLSPDTFGLDSDGDGFGCEDNLIAFVNSSMTNKSIINFTLPQ